MLPSFRWTGFFFYRVLPSFTFFLLRLVFRFQPTEGFYWVFTSFSFLLQLEPTFTEFYVEVATFLVATEDVTGFLPSFLFFFTEFSVAVIKARWNDISFTGFFT